MTAPAELTPFDPARYLDTPQGRRELVVDAFATGDRKYVLNALRIAVRAIGASEVARRTGLSRATLYDAFSDGGNPTLATLEAVLGLLGLTLSVIPVEGSAP